MGKTLREKIEQTQIIKANFNEKATTQFGAVFIGAEIIKDANDDIDAIRNMVREYCEFASEPILFASDFENGCGSMITGLTVLPYLMNLGCANSKELAYDYGKATALEAKSVGVQWSFSPVCDLNTNPRNPIVNVRGISDDPNLAIPLLKNVIKGMEGNGLAATSKHFPGDGTDYRDQHIVTSSMLLTFEEWKKNHGLVFSEMIKSGVSSIMVGHISFPDYQKELFEGRHYLPSTLSYEIITKLLKKEMGFKGVTVSDAMQMGGYLGWYDAQRSEIETFKAGCDMVLWPTKNYIDNLITAVESGYVSEARVDDAYDRIMELKEKLGVKYRKPDFKILTEEEKIFVSDVQKRTAESSVTLLRNENNLLPLEKKKMKITLVPITHYKPALKEALVLKEELEKRDAIVNYIPDASKISMEIEAENSNIIIYALFSRSARPIGPIDFMETQAVNVLRSSCYGRKKTIVISFGSPYFFEQYFQRAGTYINSYSMLTPSVEATVKALYGEIEFTDFSPVKL